MLVKFGESRTSSFFGLIIEEYNNPVWSPEPGQRSGYGSTKKGQAVNLNSLGEGYLNVDQNNQSHFCKRVDEEVC